MAGPLAFHVGQGVSMAVDGKQRLDDYWWAVKGVATCVCVCGLSLAELGVGGHYDL